jgi:Flp pilus assembly CpaF family ATPase
MSELQGWESRDEEMLRSYLGSAVCEALDDEEVTEVWVRPGWIATNRMGKGMQPIRNAKVDVLSVLRLLAPLSGSALSYEEPEVELSLPMWRARFAGLYAGIGGADSFFSIRLHHLKALRFSDRVKIGGFEEDKLEALRSCLADPEAGWLIVGRTGAGKSTWLRTILDEIIELYGSKEHLLTVEDSRELWLKGPFITSIETTKRLTYRQAVRVALRQAPDRFIVGEGRGGEVYDALKGGATGHGLFMSLHARTAAGGVAMALRRAREGAENGYVDPELVSEAIKYVWSVQRRGDKFVIAEALRFQGFVGDRCDFSPMFE